MFVLSILVARMLDPAQFADFVFCLVLSQLWFIPTLAGLELAGPRYLATQSGARHGIAIGTVLVLSCSFAVLAVLVSLPAAGWLGDATGSSMPLIALAAAFGIATGLRAVTERLLAALDRIGTVATIKALEALLIVVVATALLASGTSNTWAGPAWVVVGAAVFAVASYLFVLRLRGGRFGFERDAVAELLSFARHAAPSTLFAVALMYVDKFAMRIGATDVAYATYSAYFAGTLMIAVQAVFVLQGVVLPASARSGSAEDVRHRVAWLLPRLWLALPLAYAASCVVVLALLGPDYELRWVTGALFAAWATAYTGNILGLTAVIARSAPAMRRESRVLVLRCFIAVVALALIVRADHASIEAVAAIMLVLELLETANVLSMLRGYLSGTDVAGDELGGCSAT